MNTLISVNISVYNRSQMLKECLDSFLSQKMFGDLKLGYEIVVVDDGSEEDLSWVEGYDWKIKYFKQEHGGMAKGLNLAKDKSIGKFIMPFGSDDLALEGLLKKTYDCITNIENRGTDCVYTDNWIRRQDGEQYRNKHKEFENPNEAYHQMLCKQYISHGGTLWKKEKYPTYDETVGSAEDWEFFLTAMEHGCKFKLLPERLWVYRIGHPREAGSDSQNNGCEKVLNRRGYTFDKKKRTGSKL